MVTEVLELEKLTWLKFLHIDDSGSDQLVCVLLSSRLF